MPIGVPEYANVGNQLQITTPQADKVELYSRATIVADRAGLLAQADILDAEVAVIANAVVGKDDQLTQCDSLGIT
jgi:hypothetical protein